MLRTIATIGAAVERAMQDAYSELSGNCPAGSDAEKVLESLAAEERNHGKVLLKIRPDLPARTDANPALQMALRRQADCLVRVNEIRDRVASNSGDIVGILDDLIELEGSLPENMFEHFLRFLVDEAVPAVRRLADDCGRHERALKGARESILATA